MPGRNNKTLLKAVLLSTVLSALAGCTTLQQSSVAGRPGNVARVANIDAYPAEGALAEARSHFASGNFGHSAAFYLRAVEASPDNSEALTGLAASYDRIKRFDLADRIYARILALTGPSTQYYNNLGYSYMLRGNLQQARQNFMLAHQRDPENVFVANNLQLLRDAASQASI